METEQKERHRAAREEQDREQQRRVQAWPARCTAQSEAGQVELMEMPEGGSPGSDVSTLRKL